MLVLYRKIKEKRKELGWSQEELAKKMGYTDRSSIAKIETGKVDLAVPKIEQFADVLGVTPSWLMGWDDEDEPSDPPSIETSRLVAHNMQEAVDYYIGTEDGILLERIRTLDATDRQRLQGYLDAILDSDKYKKAIQDSEVG